MYGTYKIYFAIGVTALEQFIISKKITMENISSKQLGTGIKNIEFVGNARYREAVLNGVIDTKPDLLILREGLPGKDNIVEIIRGIRLKSPKTRIIFLASGDKRAGNVFLSTIISLGVYDLIIADQLDARLVLDKIVAPSTYADIVHLVPKSIVDEKTDKVLFEIPEILTLNKNTENIGELVKRKNTQIKQEKETPNDEELEDKLELEDNEDLSLEDNEDLSLNENKKEEKENNLDLDLDIDSNNEELELDNDSLDLDLENDELDLELDNDSEELELDNDNGELDIDDSEELILEETKQDSISKNKELDIDIKKKNENIKDEAIRENKNIDKLENITKNIKKEQIIKPETKVEPILNNKFKRNNKNEINKGKKVEEVEEIEEFEEVEEKKGGIFNKILQGQEKENSKNKGNTNKGIITFVGTTSNIGTSQCSFNTAINLAKKGYKTIYIDLNEINSNIDTIFDLSFSDCGIDTALNGIEVNDYSKIDDAISCISGIIEYEKNATEKSVLYKTYKKFPKNLDFLFFSSLYTINKISDNKKDNFNQRNLNDLYMYLMTKKNYDFLIVNAMPDINNAFTQTSLNFATKIMMVTTNDIAVIKNNIDIQLKLLDDKRIFCGEKVYYIVNRFEESLFNVKKIESFIYDSIKAKNIDIIDSFKIITVPNYNKEFLEANYNGQPIIWNKKLKELIKSFEKIEKAIID